MNKLRYLVCDIDGTLMDTNYPISQKTKDAFWRLQQKGVGVTLATGRNEWEAREIANFLGITAPVILANGAQIYDFSKERLLYGQQINSSEVIGFLGNHMDSDISISWHNGVSWESLPMPQFLQQCHALIMKRVILDFPKGKSLGSSRGSMFWAFRNGESQYEITPRSAEKGEGLKNLCRLLDWPICQTVAVGNDINDVSLFEVAEVGLAVGDSIEVLKECSKGILAPLQDEPIVSVARWLLGELPWEALVSLRNNEDVS